MEKRSSLLLESMLRMENFLKIRLKFYYIWYNLIEVVAMHKRLKAKNDFIFQRIFGRKENKDILISLLNAILDLSGDNNIDDIELMDNTKLEKDRIEDKQGVLDVRAKTSNGIQINIEIQLVNQYNMDKRTLFYWSKMFTEQITVGQGFDVLKKTITINILDFNFIDLKRYHTSYHLKEDLEPDYILTDVLEIHFIELPKFRWCDPDITKPLERWLLFLEDSSSEVLKVLKEKDPAIAKAEEVLDWLSSDEETVRLYELREKAIYDEITRIKGAKEEGIKEVAKNMLLNNVDMEFISKMTGLSSQSLQEIQKEIK